MNEQEQKAGEARVQALLIEHLDRVGFGRPGSMSVAQFTAMRAELCARLAYMSAQGLAALAEVMEGRGGGSARDRFPILPVVIAEANNIEQPPEDASPLMRAVFAHATGEAALRDGWAPELLLHLRANRKWPGSFILGKVQEAARPAVRRMFDLERRLADGAVLGAEDQAWHHRRTRALARARLARDLGLAEAGKAVAG
ncbi:hypothetical protein [Oceaniglobus trochenteri]|uniref:hypothetical protein n=1 Tax=Oceaniglobus trochenteri TaxID=2763260 RepID=UPI001CFFB72E|nr:hypothetical protein [Oceaniglobus trochenteri]